MGIFNFPSSPNDGDTYTLNGRTYQFNDSANVWQRVASTPDASITFVIDGGGSVITVGQKGTIEVREDFIINKWTLIGDKSGSANVDLWSRDYSTTLPTIANSVTGNIGMTISTATSNQSNNIDAWRMNKINAGNVVTYNVQSCDTITRLSVNLYGTRE